MSTGYHHNRIDLKKLNSLLTCSPEELVSFSEQRYNDQLCRVTDQLLTDRGRCSILLLSGPSASAKTTTAIKLSGLLEKKGLHSVVISLDNFFVNREDLPLLENGDPDYESIRTLDMKTLRFCFDELLATGHSDFPLFDFSSGRRSKESVSIEVGEDSLLIVEGIHALNPQLTVDQKKEYYLKLYVSPFSDYYDGDTLIMSARNLRLIRRIVRDYFHRGSSVANTLSMWGNVVKSELVDIVPYRDEADYKIDTNIMYEPGIYEYCLTRVIGFSGPADSPKLSELLKALGYFKELSLNLVPEDSVLREFLESNPMDKLRATEADRPYK